MRVLITGGCGFLGANIACEVLARRGELTIFDNLFRSGAEKNLPWLQERGKFKFSHGDIRNSSDVENIVREVKPEVVYHLSGQVAMTTSLQNPRLDFETNALGTFNLLEAVRKYSPESMLFYSSTNKVYGDLNWVKYTEDKKRYSALDFPEGFPETIPIEFHSPYGSSKGSADQYVLDYYRSFGINTVVFRHSSMYGVRQFATFDQGWVGWFCQQAIAQKQGKSQEPFTISGNGKQVRDVLYVSDLVDLYISSIVHIEKIKGEVFNIGGQMENSLSLLELFDVLEKELKVILKYREIPFRLGDQKVFVANIDKINTMTGWKPQIDKSTGIKRVLTWLQEQSV